MTAPGPFPLMMFAAGFGTRMGGLTSDRPKPMIEVSGRPLIDHALELAESAGCTPIVINLHYKPDILKTHLAGRVVQTILEEPEILETGGGLRNALPRLGTGPVATQNSDVIWAGPNPISLLTGAWNPEHMDALLMCIPPQSAVGTDSEGDFTVEGSGQLSRGPGLIYGGIQIIKTDLLKTIREAQFSLNVIWDMMMDEGRVYGLSYPGRWCDVGTPAGIKAAETMLSKIDV